MTNANQFVAVLDCLTTTIPGCLTVGVPRTVTLDFNSVWCRKYFELSGDMNRGLHCPEPEGRGIVQGMAIMTRVGAMISKHMHGHMVVKINELKFKKPVFIGNQIQMTMLRLDEDHRLTKIEVTLETLGGNLVSKFQLTLCPSR